MPTTVNDSVVSVRLSTDLIGQLDELAGEMQRSRSFLITQAVREFVEREFASLVAGREGEADIEAGRSAAGEDVREWFASLKGSQPGGKRRSR